MQRVSVPPGKLVSVKMCIKVGVVKCVTSYRHKKMTEKERGKKKKEKKPGQYMDRTHNLHNFIYG